MKLIGSFARPFSVIVCASLAGGCILTTNGEDDGSQQDGTDDEGADDDDSNASNPTSADENDDSATDPDTGNDDVSDDGTTGPSGECSENIVMDPGFEAGSPSEVWQEASTTFGTPICDTGCTEDAGVGPYEGEFWAWFGGLEEPEAASVSQTVTIPTAENALLTFRFAINSTTGTGDDEFTVLVDGTPVFMVDDAEMADYADYTRVEVDLTEFADGAEHTVRFESDHSGHAGTGLITNFFLDSVSLVTCNEGGTDSGDSDSYGGGSGTVGDGDVGGAPQDDVISTHDDVVETHDEVHVQDSAVILP